MNISAKDLAQRMADALNVDNGFLTGFAQGAISLPIDLGYLAYDFLDTENRSANMDDTERMIRLIKSGLANKKSLAKIARLVADDFLEKTDSERVKLIIEKGSGKFLGRFVTNQLLGVNLGALIAERFVLQFAASLSLGSVLSLGAMKSRAIYTSRELRSRNPWLYDRLRRMGNLDLLYFLMEKRTRPFEDAIAVWHSSRSDFNRIVELFFQKVAK
ncbi:Uncharacterised protein [Serratia rubidaea]|uniref:Uncharacterized protein n=1 Tax=Serratia rubidaea TaxID=61652 RepID=A0A447QSM1_SERRU|nr:hypothetical protein [Serratia rubidaea]CAI1017360.1 Uncharacterised protein [Serratia rubidaea]CAI1851745.1 Uncharacterised protein [Serratia rubidaea]VEA73059.1 Uncharacterised protein [Serratia rubidaea]